MFTRLYSRRARWQPPRRAWRDSVPFKPTRCETSSNKFCKQERDGRPTIELTGLKRIP